MSGRIDAFINGLPVFLIGVVVVFGMLCLLILFMVLLGKAMTTFVGKTKAPAVAASAPVVEEAAVAVEESQDELELVAVITAAIAASLGTTSDQLQVRSLRKVQRKTL